MTASDALIPDPLAAEPAAPLRDLAVLDDPIERARFSRPVAGAQGEPLQESVLLVAGMTCAACALTLESALSGVEGVREARVSVAGERAQVVWDPARTRASALVEAIRRAGYDAVPDAAAPARELRRREHRQALWRLFVAAFCAMQVMMLATPSYVAGPGELSPDMRQLLDWGGWVLTLPVMLFAAGPFFRGAWRALRARRVSMDVPVALGLGVAFVASTGATFDPGGWFGEAVYYDSLTMFVAFLLAARLLEMRARHRAGAALEASLRAMPPTALREAADGRVERVSVQRLARGDVLRVPLGEAFPADGRLIEGHTLADESLLSGEAVPVAKAAGDEVVAGSLNHGAPVRMRVDRVGADTRFQSIVAMMRDAMSQRPAAARLADRWAVPFLWAVLAVAAASALAWSLIDPSRVVPVVVAVLIVTCPCALSLAAPATLVAAAGGLARRGVMLQRLDALESLARMDHLFVDKTGTLTDERLSARSLLAWDGLPWSTAELSAVTAGLAVGSLHPVAQAVAGTVDRVTPAPLLDVEERAGLGLQARDVDGRLWRLGAPAWAAPGEARCVQDRCVLSCDGVAAARFVLDETLRPGVRETVARLREDGVRVSLLSGDRAERVALLAEQVGAADAIAGASPQDKLAAVAAAQRGGACVGMVGDGVNDGPVLARADVSLAMGQGALVARAQADAVVVSGDWRAVDDARAVARRAVRIVHQNLAWAALYNAACIPLAAAGWLPPWAAGLGMAGSSLVVVGNALRAAQPGRA